MKRISYLLSICILAGVLITGFTKSLYAEAPSLEVTEKDGLRIVEALGEILLGDDTTPARGRAVARNNARRNALEHAVGVNVQSSTVLYNSSLISDLVVTATKGLIVKEEIIEDGPQLKGNQLYYICKLKAYIKPINIEKRSNFKILKAEVRRADSDSSLKFPVFQHDDEIQVQLSVNEDSYINIFSISQDGMVSQLYPNKYFKLEQLAANRPMVFPDNTQRALGMKLRVKIPKKLSTTIESVLIIATKEKVELLTDMSIEEPVLTDLLKSLSEIDPSLWTERTVGYEVRR